MPTSVLLSIRPCFANAILNGSKTFEFRRSLFRSPGVRKVVLYASRPVAKVIGEFRIADILAMELDNLWELTREGSGIDKSYFDKYFKGRRSGYAIKIKAPRRYREPLGLEELNVRRAPQSFQYLAAGRSSGRLANSALERTRAASADLDAPAAQRGR